MKPFKPLKQYNIKLSYEEYENIPVIVVSNLPSDYKSVFSKMIDALGKVGVSHEIDKLNKIIRFTNLPSKYAGMIKSCIDDYNSGRI